MSILLKLNKASETGIIDKSDALEAMYALDEAKGYMQCVIDKSMSRNNAENCAAEIIGVIDGKKPWQPIEEHAVLDIIKKASFEYTIDDGRKDTFERFCKDMEKAILDSFVCIKKP